MKNKMLVLVSGGLDSAVCLAKAVKECGHDNVMALSLYYGQKHDKELVCANDLCKYYKVEHITQDLSEVFKFGDCTLLKGNADIAKGSYAEQQKIEEGTVATYVPFRNGLFLSYATALAYQLGYNVVVYGAHADDAAGAAYPDCSEEFIMSMSRTIHEGTGSKVDLYTPLASKNKAGVVKLGRELKVPFRITWSCYEGGEKACGKCGTCIDRLKAFELNGMKDPIEYM